MLLLTFGFLIFFERRLSADLTTQVLANTMNICVYMYVKQEPQLDAQFFSFNIKAIYSNKKRQSFEMIVDLLAFTTNFLKDKWKANL